MDKTLHELVMQKERPMSRRAMLRAAGCGFGYLGLADILAREAQATSFNPLWRRRLRTSSRTPSA